MSVQELEVEALKLDLRGRAALAEKLLKSLEEPSETEIEHLWVEEALRRKKDLEEGRAKERDAEDVFRDAHARLK